VALQLPGDTAGRRSYRYGRLTAAPVRRGGWCRRCRCGAAAECGEIEYGELPVAYYPLPQRLSTQSCGDDAPDESPFRRARALRLDALRPTSTRAPSPCAAKSSVTSSRCATLPSTCGTRRAQDLRTCQRMPHRHDGSLPGRPTRRRHLLVVETDLGAISTLNYVVIGDLTVGIGRAWQLVGHGPTDVAA
jgi:hypothetical protein